MGRRSRIGDPNALRIQLVELLTKFEVDLGRSDLREKVLAILPSFRALQGLGCSLPGAAANDSGVKRILAYFKQYVGQVLNSEEFMVVSGIQDYPRRIRELRVQDGWPIVSGVTTRVIVEEAQKGDEREDLDTIKQMGTEDYILLRNEQDTKAAARWKMANDLRKSKGAVIKKILEYLRKNVGQNVTGEELIYIANQKSEWARRVRQLRTEYGWPIATQFTGRPDLPVGVYVLQEDRQSPPHDRVIKDRDRRIVLMRDKHTCQTCGWNHEKWNPSDPRHLEVHHRKHHVRGGSNLPPNLETLCNICHDERHAQEGTAAT